MKARITAYSAYQLRDWAMGRMPPLVLVTCVAAWAYARANGLTVSDLDPAAGIAARAQVDRAFQFVLGVFAVLTAVLAAQGLAARDRWRGYQRVIFARPVGPVRYYAQGFVAAGLGGVLLGAIGAEMYSLAIHPVSVPGVAAFVALAWFVIGGLGFALAARTALHTPLVLALLGADLALDRYAAAARAAASAVPAVASAVQFLLPPGHVVIALREPLVRGVVPDPRVLAWPATFGAVCVVAALILLRRRAFAP